MDLSPFIRRAPIMANFVVPKVLKNSINTQSNVGRCTRSTVFTNSSLTSATSFLLDRWTALLPRL